MKYVLIFVLYANIGTIAPILGHKVFNNSTECEVAKQDILKRVWPNGVKGAATCISETELLNYTRT